MPIDYSKYPSNWKTEIRPRILARAGNCCEQCGIANGITIIRSDIDPAYYIVFDEDVYGYRYMSGELMRMSEIPEEYADGKHVQIVLTIAHLDHDTTNNADTNLKALCQKCHLAYDAKHHAKNASRTRAEKKQAAIADTGQMELFT